MKAAGEPVSEIPEEVETETTQLAADDPTAKAVVVPDQQETDLNLETENSQLTVEAMDHDSKKSQSYSPNRQVKHGKKCFIFHNLCC